MSRSALGLGRAAEAVGAGAALQLVAGVEQDGAALLHIGVDLAMVSEEGIGWLGSIGQ